jgi:hypothetical protein
MRWLEILRTKRLPTIVRTLCTSSRYRSATHAAIGEKVQKKIKRWLIPPDPSTNYNNGLRNLHQETATWLLDGCIFQEWHSTGHLLWIHGKREFVETLPLPIPDTLQH